MGKIGKQILKRERKKRKDEKEKEKKMSEASEKLNKSLSSAWHSMYAALKDAGHTFESETPRGIDKCIKCRFTINKILEKSSGKGYLLTCCPRCGGTGEMKAERYDANCILCDGKSVIDKQKVCPTCKGKGCWKKDSVEKCCSDCRGTGRKGGWAK